MDISSLPFASIENEFLRVDYLTTRGPRIIGLFVKKLYLDLLAKTPEAHWPTPHGENYLHGGHRLWTAPENPFYTCPQEGLSVIEEDDGVTLKGRVDASCLEKEIRIRLHGNRVHLSHRVTWHGGYSIQLAAWGITQLRLGGIVILPLKCKGGFLPDRNIVFWPYTQIRDVRLDLFDDIMLLYGRGLEQAFKVGNFNSHGWIAYTLGNVLFVKRFNAEREGSYPDMGCNMEAYVKDSFMELETLGPLKTLKRNESVTHEETWEVHVGEYPLTLEGTRNVSRQLSLP